MSSAGTLMTPRIDSRIRQKLMLGKCKRIDFKDILRERFNHRIKENRRTLLEKIRSSRNIVDVQNTLSGYLAAEMQEFKNYVKQNAPRGFGFLPNNDAYYDQELEEMDRLHEEFLEEQFAWIMDEYRREEEQIEALMTESLACPLCKRGILQKPFSDSPITCSICHVFLSSSVSLHQFETNLRQHFDEHSARCFSDPEFLFISECSTDSLLMVCSACSLFNALN